MPNRVLQPWERKKVRSTNRDTIYSNQWNKMWRRKYYAKYGGKCEVCDSTENKLTFHHLAYPNGRTYPSTWHRTKHDLDEYPLLFSLVCMRCHKMIEFLLNPEWRQKSLAIIERTEKARLLYPTPEGGWKVRRTRE